MSGHDLRSMLEVGPVRRLTHSDRSRARQYVYERALSNRDAQMLLAMLGLDGDAA